MENENEITNVIINSINTIFGNLFSSIDNSLYSILDDITFINTDILEDKYFENIFGTSSSNGILLIANAFLLGFILFFAIKFFISKLLNNQIESPFQFIFKLLICSICMNCSFFILNLIINFNSNITLAIRSIGESLFNKNICFSELINSINNKITINSNSLNIFSIDGLIKITISMSLINLIFSYSLRYILLKIFILISPFAILSLSLTSSSWFFKSWIKNIFSLLFIQIIVSIILLIIFSIDFSSENLFSKFIYIGAMYALIKANSFVREFIGGVSTTFSQNVNNLSYFIK